MKLVNPNWEIDPAPSALSTIVDTAPELSPVGVTE
jgi:hypothetical protein